MARDKEDSSLDEMTTSANIATTPSKFILTKRRSWPFGDSVAPVTTLAMLRKKSSRKYKNYGPYIAFGELVV